MGDDGDRTRLTTPDAPTSAFRTKFSRRAVLYADVGVEGGADLRGFCALT